MTVSWASNCHYTASMDKNSSAKLDQLLLQPQHPMPVRAINRAFLVDEPAVAAGGNHAQTDVERSVMTGVIAPVDQRHMAAA